MPFPRSNEGDLLGVYWSDADTSGTNSDCCGDDLIYFHIYADNTNQSRRIYNRATADGRKYINPTFTANWVMVVTWSRMIPRPYDINQFSNEVCNAYMKEFLTFIVKQTTTKL